MKLKTYHVQVETPTPWDSIFTIHWFATGKRIMCENTDILADQIYNWWRNVVEKPK